MGILYPNLRHIATGGGALSMGLVGYANVDKLLLGGLEWSSPPVLIAGALAGLGAVAIAAANEARAHGRGIFAAMLLLAVVASEATGFYNTFEGLLTARERKSEATRTHNASVTAAKAAENSANREVLRLSQEVTDETKAGGCKSICKGLKDQLVAAKVEAQAAAEAAVTAGTLRAESIVAHTLGIPIVAAEATPTLLGAYALLAFSILLPWFGHPGRQVAPEPSAVGSEDAAVTDVVRRVLAALDKGEAQSNDELAERLGVPKGTASKWATAAEHAGAIRRHRDGRKVRLVRVA